MTHKQLQIGGHGYIGKAGTGGETFEADTTGTTADRVWYRIPPSGLGGAIYEGIFGKDVMDAYLDPQERSRIEGYGGVKYKTEEEVRNAGSSDYILWLTK